MNITDFLVVMSMLSCVCMVGIVAFWQMFVLVVEKLSPKRPEQDL